MKIKAILSILLALTMVVFLALSLSLMRITDLLVEEAGTLIKAADGVRIAKDLKNFLLIHNRNSFLSVLHSDPARLESDEQERARIDSLLESAEQSLNSSEEAAVFADVKREIASYLQARDRISRARLPPIEEYGRMSRNVDATVLAIDRFAEVNHTQMAELVHTISRQNEKADQVAIFLLFTGVGILLFVTIGTVFKVARPLTSLGEAIAGYGSGNSSVRADVKGLYETRLIATNFNLMADRLEEQRQNQLRFIASIAHDLRNPLGSISMAAELLIKEEDEQEKGIAGIIHRQVKGLDRLVGDLLDMSRIEAGQLELELSVQDIASTIRNAVELHKIGSDLHGFKLQLPSGPLVCRCDGRRISQVLNNLLSNAMKYSPNGGTIIVKAWLDAEHVCISVSDQGIGIEPHDFDDIFKPFHRSKATRGTIPGVGLGLSASRRIVEAHGGTLKVESSPGSGSTFELALPVSEKVRQDAPANDLLQL